MNKQTNKLKLKHRRHKRVRAKVSGTADVPRVSVFRSNNRIYGQAIDDQKGSTLATQSDLSIPEKQIKEFKTELKGKGKIAFMAGQLLAEKIKAKKINKAVFDRGGFKYHGRIKAFAEGLRSGGIKV